MKGKIELRTLCGVPGNLPHSEVIAGLLVAALVSLFLSWGFIPGSEAWLGAILKPMGISGDLVRGIAFPLTAWLFSISSAEPLSKSEVIDYRQLFRISVFPFFVALLYSYFTPQRPMIFDIARDPETARYFVWYAISIPLGEELLFRKWMFSWAKRWFQDQSWPDTNPLPVVIWVSALSFSLWHFQNLSQDSVSAVLFQVGYTFIAGIWLGYLRWLTGRLWPSMVGHFFINAVC